MWFPTVVSQVEVATAFLARLFKKRKLNGHGTKFRWTIFHQLDEGQWYAGYEILDTTPTDPLAYAEVDWVKHNLPIAISGDELDMNTGKEAVHDLMEEKFKAATASVKHYMGSKIFKGQGAGVKEPLGIADGQYATTVDDTTGIVAENPAARAYGGKTAGTDDTGAGDITDWWQNVYIDEAGGALDLGLMNKTFSQLEARNSQPTIIVSSFQGLNAYWAKAQPQQRIPHDKITAIGFRSYQFNGIPIVGDTHCLRDSSAEQSNFYFLHEPDLFLVYLNGKYMKRTPWYTPKDQDAKVMHIRNKFAFGAKTPRAHGVYYDVAE